VGSWYSWGLADTRYHALPADMAPHLPDHISWEEAGSIQPLAVRLFLDLKSMLMNRSVFRLVKGHV
jgi:hypothetical protein